MFDETIDKWTEETIDKITQAAWKKYFDKDDDNPPRFIRNMVSDIVGNFWLEQKKFFGDDGK